MEFGGFVHRRVDRFSLGPEVVPLPNFDARRAGRDFDLELTGRIEKPTVIAKRPFAGAIAGALRADRLLFLTDVPGVLDKDKNLIKELSVAQAQALIKDGTISGGMIPKVETCIDAIKAGVQGVVILNGKTSHSVLLEIYTEGGAGTLIVP